MLTTFLVGHCDAEMFKANADALKAKHLHVHLGSRVLPRTCLVENCYVQWLIFHVESRFNHHTTDETIGQDLSSKPNLENANFFHLMIKSSVL